MAKVIGIDLGTTNSWCFHYGRRPGKSNREL